jgi:poly-gamma-glutamate capsule biosynthesis protein CapA/YwtB (metallophosphatase superfamily)
MKYDGKYFLDNVNGSIIFSLKLREESKLVNKILSNYLTEDIYTKGQYQLGEVTTLNQTGVTAISRDVAFKIEAAKDYGYPAKRISSFLKSTDLTHISNEVSSVAGCVPAQSMRFCAKPEYMKSLVDVGTDIVSLTGNHNNDFGADNNLSTIKQYEKLGIKYFGGGKNLEDASKILYVENKGNKIAFLGYNYYDTVLGTGAIAGKDRAGANSYSDSKMKKDIATAKKNADLVFVDFQFQECYSYPSSDVIYPICYKPLASPDQTGLFRKAIDYGADIVVGVQAHQPQTYEIYKGKTIFYGLGNLFFDQIEWIGTRQGLILTHYFKEGKYIQTKISTTLYDGPMQTYISTGKDRQLLLNLLKEARGD